MSTAVWQGDVSNGAHGSSRAGTTGHGPSSWGIATDSGAGSGLPAKGSPDTTNLMPQGGGGGGGGGSSSGGPASELSAAQESREFNGGDVPHHRGSPPLR